MTKLETILETKKLLVYKLVFIIDKQFLNWCLITIIYLNSKFGSKNFGNLLDTNLKTIYK